MARYKASEGLIPDRVIVSTAKRTQETWELFAPVFPPDIGKGNDARIYEAPKDNILSVIREADDASRVLLLIGHNPGFNEVTYSLINTDQRSEEHTSELQSLMRISYAVFCLKKKNKIKTTIKYKHTIK